MNQYGWLFAGGAALTGIIAMVWGYIRSFWQQVASYVIVSCDLRGKVADAVSTHCWKHFSTSKLGFRTYIGWSIFVRPSKRVQLVAMEIVGQTTKLYWRGWRPLWITRSQTKDESGFRINGDYISAGARLTFIRGTFSPDELVAESVATYNHIRVNTGVCSRYHVNHVFGTAGKPANLSPQACSTSIGDSDDDLLVAMQNRVLTWTLDDLGTSKVNHGHALDQLALPAEAEQLVVEIKRWKDSEDWFKERCIPWRRGWNLQGAPGTGKTSLVRAVGEDLDLPIYTYHLSTLYNNELQEAWQQMLSCVPCIALIEDIDGVFDGRKNLSGPLTFDCLLNCMDGIERTDGVLLVVTTNCPEKLDPALNNRPGRIDHTLTLGPLTQEGRYKLCQRILKEWPQTWDTVVAAGDGDTGAQFQERCSQLALNKWKQR
jgi:hypothetical protein